MGNVKRNYLKTPGYPGARVLNTDTDPRPLPVPVGIIVPDGSDLEMLKRKLRIGLLLNNQLNLFLTRHLTEHIWQLLMIVLIRMILLP